MEWCLPKPTASDSRLEGDPALLRKLFALSISAIFLAMSLFIQSVSAQSGDALLAKSRAKVEKLGVGSRVEVKLRDTTRLKGHIDAAASDSFTVVDKTGAKHDVAYIDVADVKKPGSGLSNKSWIILGSVAAGAIVTWIIVKPALCDGGAQTRGPC